jgi:phage terminase small subunit
VTQSNPTDQECDIYAQAFVRTGDKTKSFRETFPNSKSKPEAAHAASCRFHSISKVLLRIEQLAAITAETANVVYGITAESLIKDLAEIKAAALADESYAPAVSAVMGMSKICGFDVNKLELSGKDGGAIKTDSTFNFIPIGKDH